MRPLLVLVIAMGVLIVAGVATVAVTILHRMGSPPLAVAATAVLNEPAGTRIGGISAVGDRLAIMLQGGGADRVIFVDGHGRVIGRLALAR